MPVSLKPDDLAARVAEGVLAFPATPFSASGDLDEACLATHVAWLAEQKPCALVPAGGAGELFSLDLAEHERVIRTTVDSAGAVPVIAGVGNGLPIAIQMAKAAERAGADAVLLLPPYLTTAEQAGLSNFIEQVCNSVSIGVIAYSRNNGVLTTETALRLADRCDNFVGVKDGVGDFESLNKLALSAAGRLVLINGVPTAEILARQCFAIGIRAYSSAVFSFAPHIARRFFDAVRDDDKAISDRLMADLYLPLIGLRNRRRGYAVSLVKGGLQAVGLPAGPVRAPLLDLLAEEVAEIGRWVETVSAFLAANPHGGVAPASGRGV
jgi:5-dehydro-4-deoxyglucarate dehydratase